MKNTKLNIEELEKMYEHSPEQFKDELLYTSQLMLSHPAYGSA